MAFSGSLQNNMELIEKLSKQPNMMAPLTLAYIGDSVYDVYIRTRLIAEHPDMPVHQLHVHAVKFVKAQAQCKIIHGIMDMLSEEEINIYKRGRNSKSHTTAKNASLVDYRHATGFEALIGYVYLKGEKERLEEILNAAYEKIIE